MIFLLSDFANGKAIRWLTFFYCQENSEFWYHEKARFLKIMFLVGKYAENERFLEVVDYQLVLFSLQTMGLSKLCNEAVKAMEWACQMWYLRASDATCERVKA